MRHQASREVAINLSIIRFWDLALIIFMVRIQTGCRGLGKEKIAFESREICG